MEYYIYYINLLHYYKEFTKYTQILRFERLYVRQNNLYVYVYIYSD